MQQVGRKHMQTVVLAMKPAYTVRISNLILFT